MELNDIDLSDDEIPTLSAATLEVLAEFYQEHLADANTAGDPGTLELPGVSTGSKVFQKELGVTFPEDWQLSQFWYDDATSETLAKVVTDFAEPGYRVACLSCPSVFRACGFSENIHLFEYDKRFAVFGPTFYFYDYNRPENILPECISSYNLVIADPPFLSEECLSKVSVAIKKLLQEGGKIILCTGAVMENTATELLNLRKTDFVPRHKNNLGNTFACFTNLDFEINE